jgi:hypothetical protein
VQTGVDVAEKSVTNGKGRITILKAVWKQCESSDNVSRKTVAVEKAGTIKKVAAVEKAVREQRESGENASGKTVTI